MEFLSKYRTALEGYLKSQTFTDAPTTLYDPVNYILSIGGKRVRPLMLLMATDAVGGDIDQALPAAMAVEVFHNFTLLHDDIMDDAPIRRGHPTVHIKYDINTAILSGDVMLIHAYNYLGKSQYEAKGSLFEIFSKMAIEVCEGQQYDVDFETMDDVQITDYIEMIRLKTSVLLGAAMQIGALIGGASAEQAQSLYHFGMNAGIAFQIQDDVLDIYGSPKVGKVHCGDIIQNKKTYLYLKALELSSTDEQTQLLKWYDSTPEDPTQKIAEVKAIFQSANVKGYAEELKMVYRDLAISHLKNASLEEEAFSALSTFADYLLDRKV